MNLKKPLALILCAALTLCLFSGCKSEQDKFYDELMSAKPSQMVTPEVSPSLEVSAAPASSVQPDGAASGTIYNPEESPGTIYTPKEGLSGTLRIGGMSEYLLSDLIRGFMTLYPGITVETDFGFTFSDNSDTGDTTFRVDSYAQRQMTELMAGTAPDVFIPSFNYQKSEGKGLLCDLNTLIDNDPEFQREEYFENIFTAMEKKGKLHALPLTVTAPYVHFNTRVTDALGIDVSQYETVTAMQILDIYGRALDDGVIGEDFWLNYEDAGKIALWTFSEKGYYLNAAEGKPRFDSPECIAFLEASRRIQTKRTVETSGLTMASDALETLKEKNNALIYMDFPWISTGLIDYLLNVPPYTSKAIPLVTNDQKHLLGLNMPSVFCIPESSRSQEIAWEFIKYCIMENETATYLEKAGEVNGDRFKMQIPVNRNNLKKYMDAFVSRCYPEGTDFSAEYALIADWMEAINQNYWHSGDLNFNDILTQYYDSQLITAEECAKKMQERAEIFLNE